MAKLSLHFFDGAQPGTVYEYLEGVIRVGRDADNDIVFGDSSNVSRRHAEIKSVDGAWLIVDLKSANGTLLNRQQVNESRLRHGDELQFGAEGPRLRVSMEGSKGETTLERDTPAGEPTPIELFPPHMGLEPIKGKGFLIPGVIAVSGALAILAVARMGNITLALTVLQALFAAATVGLIYRYCGKTKPLWVFVGSGVIIGIILAGLHAEIIKPLQNLILPMISERVLLSDGRTVVTVPETLPRQFFYMLFLAAIPEELEKIVPAMLGLWLFFYVRSRRKVSPLQSDLLVREPLDGILLGVAAAAGFSVIEGVMNPAFRLETSLTAIHALAAKSQGANLVPLMLAAAQAGVSTFAEALFRAIGNIAGHQAYSGIFGYYVGLAALYPARKGKLILRGFVTAVLLHTLWNTLPVLGKTPVIGLLVTVVGQGTLIFCSLAMLIACILQARKISPTRANNFATNLEASK